MAKDIVEVISPDQWTAFGWISSAFEQSKIIQHHYSIFNHLKLISILIKIKLVHSNCLSNK